MSYFKLYIFVDVNNLYLFDFKNETKLNTYNRSGLICIIDGLGQSYTSIR
jgi:hypothetical protein